jgi:hypothetical protein
LDYLTVAAGTTVVTADGVRIDAAVDAETG